MKKTAAVCLTLSGLLILGAAGIHAWVSLTRLPPAAPEAAGGEAGVRGDARTNEALVPAGALPGGEAPPVGRAMRFSPGDGEAAGYRVSVDGAASIDLGAYAASGFGFPAPGGAPGNVDLAVRFEGVLSLRFYAAGPGAWDVAATVVEPAFTINREAPDYASNLAHPFAFRMDASGRMSGFRFARGTRPEARDFLKGLVLGLEVVLPGRAIRQWQAREADNIGEYVAAYELQGDVPASGGAELEILKKKLSYPVTRASREGINPVLDSAQTMVLESGARCVVSEKGPWLRSLSETQRLAQDAGGRQIYGSRTTREARLLTGRDAAARFPDTFAAFSAELNSGKYLVEALNATDAALNRMAEGLDLLQALAKYKALSGSEAFADRQLADAFLVNYMRLHPESVQDLVAVLNADTERREYTDQQQLDLWLLITEAGTFAAQKALVGAVEDPASTELTRFRALAYASDFTYPDEATVRTLYETYQAIAPGETEEPLRERKAMSLLAFGALGYRDKQNDQVKPYIREKLVEALADAADAREQRTALRAIGNCGDPGVLGVVEPYLSSPDTAVRADACQALRRMDSPEAERALVRRLEVETSPYVRDRAIEALAYMVESGGGPEGLQWAREALFETRDPDERVALVKLLGSHPDAGGKNEVALRRMLGYNPARETQKAIYGYIAPR